MSDYHTISTDGIDASPLPSALTHFRDIRRRLSEKEPVVFLDYDGTLSPIVQNPEDADLADDMRAAVAALARVCTVAIVSGRDLEDVRRRVGLPELYYAGSHGFDIRGPEEGKITHQQGKEFLPRLDAVETLLRDKIRDIQGAQVERKRFSVAVHYRQTPNAEQSRIKVDIEAALNQVQGLRVSSGKKVFDFQPDLDWHKGKAVRWLIDEALKLERARILPIYIGDDITDEDAFAELSGEGIAIVVDLEERDSQAGYALKDTTEVRAFLLLLTETLQRLQSRNAWIASWRRKNGS